MVRIIILCNLFFPFRSWLRQFFLTTLSDNPAKRWECITDQVIGGVSTGVLSFVTKNGASYAQMTGSISFENYGGGLPVTLTNVNKV